MNEPQNESGRCDTCQHGKRVKGRWHNGYYNCFHLGHWVYASDVCKDYQPRKKRKPTP